MLKKIVLSMILSMGSIAAFAQSYSMADVDLVQSFSVIKKVLFKLQLRQQMELLELKLLELQVVHQTALKEKATFLISSKRIDLLLKMILLKVMVKH